MAHSLIFLIIIWTVAAVFSFNIDTSVPIMKQSIHRGKSYFGFSVFPHKLLERNQYRVLVGAPLDNMSNYVEPQRPSGAVYSCPITIAPDDCRALLMLKLPPMPGLRNLYPHQWLGVHVSSDTVSKGGHYAYTCSHRYMRQNLFANKLSVPGQCMAMHNSLRSSGSNSLIQLSPNTCSSGASSLDKMCLRGTALASRPDLGVLAMGAANERRTSGAVYYTHHRPRPASSGWNQTGKPAPQDGYAGYSVALGKIYGERLVNFTLVAGAPGVPKDQTGGGEVRLFAVTEKPGRPAAKTVLRGEQFGSRFGQVVLALDINGDGWDDLIVGAPDYEEAGKGSFMKFGDFLGVRGCGAVYVYINEEGSKVQERSLRRIMVLRPRRVSRAECQRTNCLNARFGAALAAIGDIDMDGRQDLGIGAPGEGGGVVYIYRGHGKTGLTEKPSQVLVGSSINKVLRGFGTSLAGGLDLDGNRYPDIVIGAPLSGHAVILRTRPVIDVQCSVVFDPAELDPTLQPSSSLVECGKDGRCLPAKVYLSYKHAGKVDGKFSHEASYPGQVTLTLDGGDRYPRIVFERGEASSYKQSIQLSHWKVMQRKPAFTVRLYINPKRFIDKMNPINLTVSWRLDLKPPTKTGASAGRLPDLNQFPIYDGASSEKTFHLPWKMTCLQPVCISKVKLRMKTNLERSPGRFIFYFGREDDFWLNFTVTNSREPAHKTILNLEFTDRLVLLSTKCPYKCSLQDSRLRCPLANPLMKGQKMRCAIHISGSNIVPDTPRLDFAVSLLTVSDNANGARTNISFSASVQILADIRMTSIVEPEMVIYGKQRLVGASSVTHEKRIGPRVTFTFLLENRAKSGVVPSSELIIYWPYEVLGDTEEKHGKYLLYIIRPPFLEAVSNQTLRCDSATWSDLINPNKVRLFSREQRKKTKALTYVSSGSVTDIKRYEVCSDGNARCRPIRCKLGHLSHKTGSIRIRIDARLWVHTMSEDFPEARFVPILVNVTWRPTPRYTVAQQSGNDTSVLMRLIASNMLPQPARRPDNMWMLVCLSVLAGVIILGCIILLLYKIKFFRRDRRVQEQRLAQQQQLAAQEDERHKYDYMEYD